jgi:hypothetical protein
MKHAVIVSCDECHLLSNADFLTFVSQQRKWHLGDPPPQVGDKVSAECRRCDFESHGVVLQVIALPEAKEGGGS